MYVCNVTIPSVVQSTISVWFLEYRVPWARSVFSLWCDVMGWHNVDFSSTFGSAVQYFVTTVYNPDYGAARRRTPHARGRPAMRPPAAMQAPHWYADTAAAVCVWSCRLPRLLMVHAVVHAVLTPAVVLWPAYKPTPKALSSKLSWKLSAYTRVYTVCHSGWTSYSETCVCCMW